MSEAPPRQIGPREASIKALWDNAWSEHAKGGVFEPYVAVADAELANFAANPPATTDQAACDDLAAAQNLHLFQSKYFLAHVANIDSFREQLKQGVEWTYSQLTTFNEHTVRSLTTANGGVVLAALAYIQAQKAVSIGFLWVIGLGAAGYLFTLVGSHAVVVLSSKPLMLMATLQQSRLSDGDRKENLEKLQPLGRRLVSWSRPFFYAAAVCLIASLTVGVNALIENRPLASTTPERMSSLSPVTGKNGAANAKTLSPIKVP
jgi:hypothetical protein